MPDDLQHAEQVDRVEGIPVGRVRHGGRHGYGFACEGLTWELSRREAVGSNNGLGVCPDRRQNWMRTMDTRTVNHLGMIEAAASMASIQERPISHNDENWQALPQRLRGRGDFLLKRDHIKDAELMFDAATEIEALRARG